MEFEVRLNQLIVADEMGDESMIKKYASAVTELKEDENNKGWAKELRKGLSESLKYENENWYADKAREKIKILDRYFTKG